MIYFFGLDLGEVNDYSAWSLIRRRDLWQERKTLPGTRAYEEEEILNYHRYDVEDMGRFRLGTPYPDQVEKVEAMLQHPTLRGRCVFLVDATGVGRPVVQRFIEDGYAPIPIVITGGTTVNLGTDGFYRVPKRDLVVQGQLVLESHRVKFADIPEREIMRAELESFRMQVTTANNDTYESWRDGVHDDMVLSFLMPIWYAETMYGTTYEVQKSARANEERSYDPLRHGL